MAQYVKYKEGDYRYWTDPDTGLLVRSGMRGGYFLHDAELVSGGFALAEDTGWMNIGGEAKAIAGTWCREGVRDCYYVVDAEITATGFNGTEGVDWENINGAY